MDRYRRFATAALLNGIMTGGSVITRSTYAGAWSPSDKFNKYFKPNSLKICSFGELLWQCLNDSGAGRFVIAIRPQKPNTCKSLNQSPQRTIYYSLLRNNAKG